MSIACAIITVMTTPKTLKYNTALDEEIMSLGGVPDENGNYLDIHETLFHSKTEGFYLQRKIRQSLIGRTWETLELGECDSPESARNVRFLTIYRQMTREQIMHFVIGAYMPTTEGIREEAHRLLDRGSRGGD